MKAILINPFSKTITEVMVTDLNSVRAHLDNMGEITVQQLTERAHTVLAAGVEEVPGMRWWRFVDSPPIASIALIRGNSLDGLNAEDCPLDVLLVQQNVLWLDVEFDGWQTVPKFRPLGAAPAIAGPEPRREPTPAQGRSWSLWTITEHDEGYSARLTTVDATGKAVNTTTVLENEDLDELREMLPRDLVRLDRTPTDEASIVETWHTKPSN